MLHRTRNPLPTQQPGLRHQSRGAPAVPHLPPASLMCCMAACIPDVLHGESVKIPNPRAAKPHLCENSFTTDAPSTRPGTNACVTRGGWPASPLSRALVFCSAAGMRDVWLGSLHLLCVVLPPCSGCEPHDDKGAPWVSHVRDSPEHEKPCF